MLVRAVLSGNPDLSILSVTRSVLVTGECSSKWRYTAGSFMPIILRILTDKGQRKVVATQIDTLVSQMLGLVPFGFRLVGHKTEVVTIRWGYPDDACEAAGMTVAEALTNAIKSQSEDEVRPG